MARNSDSEACMYAGIKNQARISKTRAIRHFDNREQTGNDDEYYAKQGVSMYDSETTVLVRE